MELNTVMDHRYNQHVIKSFDEIIVNPHSEPKEDENNKGLGPMCRMERWANITDSFKGYEECIPSRNS